MLSKAVIDQFLYQPLEDYSSWKTDEMLPSVMEPVFKQLKTQPFKHQEVCICLGLENPNFLFFLDMGLGKSKIVLDILKLREEEWNKVLVLSPNIVTVSTFADEIEAHSQFKYIELVGTMEERVKLLEQEAEFYLLNYTGLQLLLTNPVKGKKSTRWVIDDSKLNKFASKFDAIIWDEIHLNKNPDSLNFRIGKQLAKRIPIRYGLTGTPMNRDPIELWSQFYLIDKGETLGESLYLYREAFFNAKPSFWGGVDYQLKKDMKPILNKRLANKSIRYSKEEALDLPEKTFIEIPIKLHPDVIKMYNTEVENIGHNLELGFMKLRQLCSGFLDFNNEEGEKVTAIRTTNKLEALVELLKEIPDDSKAVVFLDFIKSGDLVSERLTHEKLKHVRLYGGTKDKKFVKNEFLHNDSIRIFVANTKSGSLGLNLQSVANYIIYFEEPISYIDYSQSIDRVHRIGQEKKVFIYSLITKDSVEEKVHKYLREGKDIFRAIVEGKIKLKRRKDAS